MEREGEKITLPRELQKEMLQFFLKTSIPKIKADKRKAEEKRLSEKSDGGG